jgi:primosomal protein N' (replication factor Y)
VLDLLRREGRALSAEEIRDLSGAGPAVLAALRRKGLVQVEHRAVEAAIEPPAPAEGPPRHVPTAEQAAAAREVREALGSGGFRSFLLVGPTGSGKTEVYFSAIEAALEAGGGAIYLVPEIALTPLLSRRCRDRFALLHSSLAPSVRRAAWDRVRAGRARLVLGARSALMAPVPDLRLVVVDEEQDGSFKQESEPRYNARDLALVRARAEGAAALLGSATPSLESWSAAERERHRVLRLTRRIESRPLASVEIVDMRREEEETGGRDPVSRRLLDALRGALDRREQAIVLLNRRGWAPSILCRRCGETMKCRRCSISLTWHQRDGILLCHYCGYRRGMPERCPGCGEGRLRLTGTGTEKLAEEVAALFPSARVARLDRDVARGRRAPERILEAFERGEHDILVGTQLVAKGHDFPRVTVVGVVAADFTLGFPDFRAAERTFQILTQVAGRAGRGERPGMVIVQAFRPDHYAIQAARSQDYEVFYAKESRYRKLSGYPPFTALACVTATGATMAHAQKRAGQFAAALRRSGDGGVRILGPAPAPLFRLKGRHRFQIIARAARRRALSDALHEALDRMERSRTPSRGILVDVDPASLL